jgi:hypothetical protein
MIMDTKENVQTKAESKVKPVSTGKSKEVASTPPAVTAPPAAPPAVVVPTEECKAIVLMRLLLDAVGHMDGLVNDVSALSLRAKLRTQEFIANVRKKMNG